MSESKGPRIQVVMEVQRVIRKEVLVFADQMEVELRANEQKGGWGDCDAEFLISELRNHLAKIERLIKYPNTGGDPDGNRVQHADQNYRKALFLRWMANDCADVANFAMMLWDNCRKGLLYSDGHPVDCRAGVDKL